jgi:hypothetical protein
MLPISVICHINMVHYFRTAATEHSQPAVWAAVAAINATFTAPGEAFAEQDIKDGVPVNSVVPGPEMTGRSQCFFERWTPAHPLTATNITTKIRHCRRSVASLSTGD